MKRWSLRRKLVLGSAAVTGMVLLIFGGAVAYSLYSEQVELIDAHLADMAQLAMSRPPGREPNPVNSLAWLRAAPSGRESRLYGFAVCRIADGSVVEAFPATLGPAVAHLPQRGHHFVREIGGDRLRFARFSVGDQSLVLAASMQPAAESVRDLLGAYAIALPLAMLVAAGGSWWLARRALQPIVDITGAAEAITADRLHKRLTVPPTEDEIARHVVVLNGMFDRLERSFEQANRFSADAAHELRTPLTILRGQIEEALRGGVLGADQERLLVGLLEETTGLQKIADNLLLLARFDTGKDTLRLAAVDLSQVLSEAREDVELLAAPTGITVTSAIDPGISIKGDVVMLRRVLVNLLDNAVKYNRSDGEVRLTLRDGGACAVLTVANTGPGIPPEYQGSLFQRFSRPDSGRNREAGGSGLGLSLCREIVLAHHGEITLKGSDSQWTEFVITISKS